MPERIPDLVAEVEVESNPCAGNIVKVKIALPKGVTIAFALAPEDATDLALAIDEAADECHARNRSVAAPSPA